MVVLDVCDERILILKEVTEAGDAVMVALAGDSTTSAGEKADEESNSNSEDQDHFYNRKPTLGTAL